MSEPLPQTPGHLVLRDIHLPPDPSWWPPAPGWWIVSGIVGSILIAVYLRYRRARRERILRERILAEVQHLALCHADNDAAYAAALHQLMRRAARRFAADAHRVQGEAWRQVLAQVPVDASTLDTLMTLDARMYQPRADFDRVAVEAAVRRWLQAALHVRAHEHA